MRPYPHSPVPWVAEPYRLRSLLDMIPFSATGFVAAYNNLLMSEAKISIAAFERYDASDWRRLEAETKQELTALAKECRELPLTECLLRQFDRAVERVALRFNR